MKDFNRVQGLIDLYHQGKSADAVRVMMDYFRLQGLMNDETIQAVEDAIAASPDAPLDVRGVIAERDALKDENDKLKADKEKTK